MQLGSLLLSHDVRLLSLTGPPGVGKTRLAMAVAESVLEAFPDGVWFVDLAPLQDPDLVGSKIVSTLCLAGMRDGISPEGLAAYLRDRRVLLFLDNFEGVLPAAAWVGRLLEQTEGLKILTTSRERLRLRWEHMVPVPPLPLPDLGPSSDLSMLVRIPSVALFLQRAEAVGADFTLSAENAPAIAALCTRLDGLPLAIELAAAHAGVLSPGEILAYMDNRFRLLGMGAPDVPERHQTLKAAIDWSYESLPPAVGPVPPTAGGLFWRFLTRGSRNGRRAQRPEPRWPGELDRLDGKEFAEQGPRSRRRDPFHPIGIDPGLPAG